MNAAMLLIVDGDRWLGYGGDMKLRDWDTRAQDLALLNEVVFDGLIKYLESLSPRPLPETFEDTAISKLTKEDALTHGWTAQEWDECVRDVQALFD